MGKNRFYNVSGTHTFEKRVDHGDLSAAERRVHVLLSPEEAALLRDANAWDASLETRLDNAANGYEAPLSGEAGYYS